MSEVSEQPRSPFYVRRSFYLYLACALVVYLFAIPAGEQQRSAKQRTFDRWITAIEKNYLLPPEKGGVSAEELLRNVKITVSGNGPQGSLAWKIDGHEDLPTLTAGLPSDKLDQQSKILRLLSLLREANIFTTIEEYQENPSESRISITVVTSDNTFNSEITEGMIAQNLPAQVMLRLFKEYSSEEDTKLAEKTDANAG